MIVNEFTYVRLLGMAIVGATFYSFEIPNLFDWIEERTKKFDTLKRGFFKATLALIYFNPLWIVRHLFFIKLFSAQYEKINYKLFEIATVSFLVNIPVSFVVNYFIQNKIELKWRFLASSVFSAVMVVYYALSENLFG